MIMFIFCFILGPVTLIKGNLCRKMARTNDYNNTKCYCKEIIEKVDGELKKSNLCLVEDSKTSGNVYKNGKPVYIKCCDYCGDDISAEEDYVKMEFDCADIKEMECPPLLDSDCNDSGIDEPKKKELENWICEKLGFGSANPLGLPTLTPPFKVSCNVK